MRKLSLKLDELAVESFETASAGAPRGTVEGQQFTAYGCVTDEYQSCGGSCQWVGTCGENTCEGTCAASCHGTCAGQGNTCDGTCGNTCDFTCDIPGTCYGAAC